MSEHIITSPARIQQVSVVSGIPRGYQQIVMDSAAQGLTVPRNANGAIIQFENWSVRWRDDGTDPTSTEGMLGFAGNAIELTTADQLNAFKFILDSNSSDDDTGKVNVAYYEKR